MLKNRIQYSNIQGRAKNGSAFLFRLLNKATILKVYKNI